MGHDLSETTALRGPHYQDYATKKTMIMLR